MRNLAYGCWAVTKAFFEILRSYKKVGYRYEVDEDFSIRKIRISQREHFRTWGLPLMRGRWRQAFAKRWSDGKRSYTMMLLGRLRFGRAKSTEDAVALMFKESGY